MVMEVRMVVALGGGEWKWHFKSCTCSKTQIQTRNGDHQRGVEVGGRTKLVNGVKCKVTEGD